MKQFYILRHSTDPEEIGEYPQASLNLSGSNDNSIIYTDNWVSKISSKTKFELILGKKAILTDFIKDGALVNINSLCYSDKIRQILSAFMLDDSKKADVNLFKKNKTISFNFLSLNKSRLDFINWEDSIFAKTRISFFEEELNINSFLDYTTYLESISSHKILTTKLALNESDINCDLFFIGLPVTELIVSDMLKQDLENNEVSGKYFIPLQEYSGVRRRK